MKKIISLLLVMAMVCSMIPTAFATNVYENPGQDTEMGTAVEYIADDEANEWWTVTVPALLNPGATGYVVAEGQFASSKTLNVTADTEVELTNSINANDKKTVDITFASIALPGDNVAAVTNVTEAAPNGEAISVAAIENALFGTWSGRFNYNVELEQVEISMGLRFNQPYQTTQDGMLIEFIFYEDGSASMWMADAMCQYMPTGTFTYEETKILMNGTETLSVSPDGTELSIIEEEMVLTLQTVPIGDISTGATYVADPNGILGLGVEITMTFNADGTATIYQGDAVFMKVAVAYEDNYVRLSVNGEEICGPVYPNGLKVAAIDGIVFVKDCEHLNTTTGHNKDATCTENGYTNATICNDCGRIAEVDTVISALGHNFEEENIHICTRCGYSNIQDYTLYPGDYKRKTGIDISSGDVVIPEKFQDTEGNWYRVTAIGNQAFWYDSINSITLPNSVTKIGKQAFAHSSLQSIEIPDSVTTIENQAFAYCSNLQSVNMSKNITSIENYTFAECKRLKSINIPDGVTNIGEDAFVWCESLESIKIPDSVTTIGSRAFGYCTGAKGQLIIPDGVSTIGSQAFARCSGLTGELTIPESVTNIGSLVFSECRGLTSVILPDNMTSIPFGLFESCSGLTGNFIIPNGVKSIEGRAFSSCQNITSINIPDSVTSIGDSAFSFCYNLTSITLPSGITSISEGTFRSCKSLTSITIPNGVTSIGRLAFSACSSFTNITIPSSVTSIGDLAFYSCQNLTSVVIPESVTTLGYSPFAGIQFLTSLSVAPTNPIYHSEGNCIIETATNSLIQGCSGSIIPNYVTTIKEGAFDACIALGAINIPESVTNIEIGAFDDASGLIKLTVDTNNKTYHSYKNCIIETDSNTLVIGCANSIIPLDGSVTSIRDNAFNGAQGLTSIIIPDCITSIGRSAFATCVNLRNVYYTGTEQEWNAITIGDFNTSLTKATIHYNYVAE